VSDAQTVLVTGASSGFGAMTARALAQAGHTVWVGMRVTTGRNAAAVADLQSFATDHDVGLLSEEYDPKAHRLVGNFPQAFSHVPLIDTARTLSRATTSGTEERQQEGLDCPRP
jgi:NAD(P)-dependent dehydrogenase (short-subunit alcohol dehydrogenase family)